LSVLAKKPNLEPNTESIGRCVAEIWPFEVFHTHTWAGHGTYDIGHRTSKTQAILYSVQCCYAVHWTDNNSSFCCFLTSSLLYFVIHVIRPLYTRPFTNVTMA